MMKKFLFLGLIASTSTLIISPASAMFTPYFGSNATAPAAFDAFESAAGSLLLGPEDFEEFTGVANPNSPSAERDVDINIGGITGTVGSGNPTFGGVLNVNFNSSANTTQPSPPATNYYLGRVRPGEDEIFKIQLDEPVQGAGFSATDIGDFDAILQIRLLLGGAVVETFGTLDNPIPISPLNGNTAFLGAIGQTTSDVFDTIELDILIPPGGAALNGDTFGIDDIYLVGVGDIPPVEGTPEPGTLISLGLLGTAGFLSRRRRK